MKKQLITTAILLAGLSITGYAASPDSHPALSLRNNDIHPISHGVTMDKSKRFVERFRESGGTDTNIRPTTSSARQSSEAEHGSIIKGSLIYSDQWPNNTSRWGIYAMPATGGELTPLTGEATYNKLDYYANGGATAMSDGFYYICTYAWQTTFDEVIITGVQGTIFDSNTWEPINYKGFRTPQNDPDPAYLATSMTYDKTTGKVYGSFYGYDDEKYSFGIFDTQEFKLQVVSLMDEAWNACAFDKDGNLYAILENGDLCTVNKRTGETSLIKSTGLSCNYQTSGTINPDDNRFYYIQVQQDKATMYSIDLIDGSYEKVYDFGYGLQLAGMCFAEPDASMLAPSAPTDLAIDFNGTLQGDLKFTLPQTTRSGEIMTEQLEYIVSVDYNEYTRGHGMPGEQITIPVTVETTATHYFDVVCVNGEGRGTSANCSAFAGERPGLPLAARNFKVIEDTERWGRLHMTWDAPEFDTNGKPINPDDVAYWVVDNNIYSWCKDYHGNSIVVDMGDLSKKQKFDDFLLLSGIMLDGRYNYNWEREGYTTTRARSFGRPYDLPWKERITYNGPDWNWVMISSPSAGHWRYWDGVETSAVTVVPVGNDGGMFLAQAEVENAILEIRGGKVALGNAENPMLIFHIYRHRSFSNDYVAAYIFEADQQSTDFYRIFSTTAEASDEEGWTECVVPLNDFKGKTIQVAFVAVCSKPSSVVAIDDIEIRNCRDNDLGITDFSTPAYLVPGRQVDFGVTVRNWGTTDIQACTVNLVLDNKVTATTDLENLKAGESRNIVFDQMPTPLLGDTCEYYAEVLLDNDEDQDNNRSNTVTLEVRHNDYPTPESLEARIEDNDVILTWDEPYLKPIDTVSESFEDSELSDDWTAYGWNIYASEDIKPKTGMAMIASLADADDADNHILISPRLSGNAQKVTLYARSGDSSNTASFSLLTSSTGTDAQDFNVLQTKSKIPVFWTKYEFELPQDTRYFAIKHDTGSATSGNLLIDDITYESHGYDNLMLNGYNIYNNGSVLNTEPNPETEFVHVDGAIDGGIYHITAIYEQGESKACNPVSVTGIGGTISVIADHAIRVMMADEMIIVTGYNDSVKVYTTDGRLAAYTDRANACRLTVTPGLYIVVADGESFKVSVR